MIKQALVLPLVLMAGCAALNVQRPTATLQSMSLGDVTADGITLNFLTSVSNLNTVALPLSAADYDLSLAGVKVLSNTTKLDKGLAAGASTQVTLPVLLRFDDLMKAEQAIVKTGGDVPLAFGGSLVFTPSGSLLPGQTVKVPVSYSGTLPLKRVLSDPQALAQSPVVRELAKKIMTSYFSR
jgi:LEA14-like dessication related protein